MTARPPYGERWFWPKFPANAVPPDVPRHETYFARLNYFRETLNALGFLSPAQNARIRKKLDVWVEKTLGRYYDRDFLR